MTTATAVTRHDGKGVVGGFEGRNRDTVLTRARACDRTKVGTGTFVGLVEGAWCIARCGRTVCPHVMRRAFVTVFGNAYRAWFA